MPSTPQTTPAGEAWIEMPDASVRTLAGDCYFGRISGNEVVVPDVRTSRRHAVVQRQGSRFVLVDLGSTNGTRLNERRVFKPAVLNDGDVIGIGGLRYVFHAPAGSGEHATSQPLPTTAAVGVTPCWVLVASAPEGADSSGPAWLEELARDAAQSGGRARRMRGQVLLLHWREALTTAAAVRGFLERVAARPAPAGSNAAIHHGQVRVGPAADPSEETLLGSDVAFAHGLVSAARELRVAVLLSDAAARTLGLAGASALGARPVGGAQGVHPLFSLGKAGS